MSSTTSSRAQDKIVAKTGAETIGKIIGVKGQNVQVQLPAGTIGVRLDTIARVEMPPPANFAKAMSLMEAGDSKAALPILEPLATNFLGLPVDWARQAAAAYGAALIAENRLPEAEKAFAAFQAAYPGEGGSDEAKIGMARIAIEQSNGESARATLLPFVEKALANFDYESSDGRLYSGVFVLMGRIEEAAGNKELALQNYLRTTTAFPHDKIAVAEATKRSEALKDVIVP